MLAGSKYLPFDGRGCRKCPCLMPGASAQVGHFWCHRFPPDLRLCGRLAAGAHASRFDERLFAELRDFRWCGGSMFRSDSSPMQMWDCVCNA